MTAGWTLPSFQRRGNSHGYMDGAGLKILGRVGLLGLFTLLYGLLAWVSMELTAPTDNVGPLWLVAGLGAGGVIAAPPLLRRWLLAAIFVTLLAVCRGRALDWGIAFPLAFAGAIEAMLCASIFSRLVEGRHHIAMPADALWLAVAAASSSAMATLVAMMGRVVFAQGPDFDLWLSWWLSDTVGIITIAPVFLARAADWHKAVAQRKFSVVLAVIALPLATFGLMVGPGQLGLYFQTVPLASLIPFILWIGLRHRPPVAAAAGVALVVATVLLTANGFGPFANLHVTGKAVAEQVFLLAACSSVLGLSLLFTERRETERTLANAEARLRLAFDVGEIVAWDLPITPGEGLDPTLAATMAIVSDTTNDKQGTTGAWIHPDDAVAAMDGLAIAIETQGLYSMEHRIQRSDGSVGWVAVRARALYDQRGRPVRTIGVARDVSRRRATQGRQSFILALADALLADPDEVCTVATALLREKLDVARVSCAIFRPDGTIAAKGEAMGRSSSLLAIHVALDALGTEVMADLRAGRIVSVANMAKDLRTVGAVAEYRSARTLSLLSVPVLHQAGLRAIIHVNDDRVRNWTDDEIALVREAAVRVVMAYELTEARALLASSEARLHLAMNAAQLGLYEYDIMTGSVDVDDRVCDLWGVEPDDALTYDDFLTAVHPDDRCLFQAAVDRTMNSDSGGAFSTEYRVISRKDGQTRWITATGQGVFNQNRLVRIVGSVKDVTARHMAETALAASEAQFRTTAEALPGLLFLATASGHNIYVNQQYRSYTGLSDSQLLGTGWQDALHPDDLGTARAAWEIATTGGEAYSTSYRVRRHDGKWRWHAARALPICEQGDRWVGTAIDIQDLRAAELELKALNRDLATRVSEAVKERERALAHLHEAQKMETLGQLTGGIAHDFNNLLTPIIGALDLVERRVEDQRTLKLVAGAIRSAERAKTLVQRLLAFARRQTLMPVAVDIGELLGGMKDLIASSVGPRVEVKIDMQKTLPPALVDANQLELALLNLAVNARDAMPRGGVLHIAVVCTLPPEGLGLAGGKYLGLTISDTGCGMDEATRARAVQPFFTTKDIGRGTGLGLSMVHGLAAQSGGAFELDSVPGKGTRATIWLPSA